MNTTSFISYETYDNDYEICSLSFYDVKQQESIDKICCYCSTINNFWTMYKTYCGHFYHTRCFRKEMNKQFTDCVSYNCIKCSSNLKPRCVRCDIIINTYDKLCKQCLIEFS